MMQVPMQYMDSRIPITGVTGSFSPSPGSPFIMPTENSSVAYSSLLLPPTQPGVARSVRPPALAQPMFSSHPSMIISPADSSISYGYQNYSLSNWDQQQQQIMMSYSLSPQQMMSMHVSRNAPYASELHVNNPVFDSCNSSGNDRRFTHSQNRSTQSRRRVNEPPKRGAPPPPPPPITSLPSISEVRGNVQTLAKEQLGCRVLQQLLASGHLELRDLIMKESMEVLNELMVDAFGNYLFQKLIECADESQRLMILQTVQKSLVHASLNLHGTRSVQRTVEVCCTSAHEVSLLVEAFQQSTVRLCTDQNGNHVIQKCLLHFQPADQSFIFSAVTAACVDVCTQRHGCCVVQRCLDASRSSQGSIKELGAALSDEVVSNAVMLMQHQYGNYVVQYVMDSYGASEVDRVCILVAPLLVPLSLQKFASNVIEKCLKKGSSEMQTLLVDELAHSDRLAQLLEDQFGNYVVQSALDAVSQSVGMRLVEALRPHLIGLRNTSGGRRIMAKLVKNYSLTLFNDDLANLSLQG
eukprot:CAMPEP_0182418610 /NCGR_PEP_ID=MMETSP1167-20130531/2992_1 /TAXON_ID=2988 /ORGANISM="Mallomonas Sp, Strain CCMP3275" /LENGTH=523 /DNA_ID=CAMNT_0024592889 /DNA_START=42 /DNA_END=1613 /DNA_ORIENTATION=-